MSENELKAIVDAANRRVEVVVPEGFAVMVNGIRMAPPALGTEQNPAKNRADLPNGTGIVVNFSGSKEWWVNGEELSEAEFIEWSKGTAKTTDSTITPDEFPVGCEQNPAKALDELPDGTGLVMNLYGTKAWYKNWRLHCENGPAIEWASGTKEWYKNGERHREDGPAVVYSNGEEAWYKNGALHREDGPAVEWADGSKEYWLHGQHLSEAEFLERSKKVDPKGTAKVTDSAITPDEFPVGSEHNPAKNRDELPNGTGLVVNLYGTKTWYMNGQRHREDGPAVEYASGTKEWWVNGKLHREDGPAVEWSNGDKDWYLNGVQHRDDGPAIEWADGEKEWFQNGVYHREDGPAVDLNGYKEYWLHGERMTEEEFIEWSKGTAKVTDSTITPDEFPVGCEQNPAKSLAELPDGTGLVVTGRGTKAWYKNWRLHCENGPAVEWASGTTKFWVQNGKKHRVDGPAVERADGSKEYWLHGERMTEAEFLERSKKVDPKGTAKDSEKDSDSTIAPDESPVGSEQNPAKSVDDLPNGTGIVVNGCGTKTWYMNGQRHREDGPAVEWASGTTKFWYQDGEKHRVDGPAVEWSNGYKEWWVNGELHKEDGPAIEYATGEKEWYKNGVLHREDGPAVEGSNGYKEWWVNGELHKEDGPAIEYASGSKEWYKNGVLHREDGPAMEGSNGYKEWYLNGEELSEAEFIERSKGTANTTDSAVTSGEFPLGSEQNPAKNLKDLPNGTGVVTMTNGTKFWYKNNKLHREDGPAIESVSECKGWYHEIGTKRWYLDGKKHREDGPAVEHSNGDKDWYLNGELHREDGPAIEYANGTKFWYLNGKRHREDAPAAEYANGTKAWYKNGELHRVDGPAVEYGNGNKFWYKNGEKHREDGPAVEYSNGIKAYWIHGEYMEKVEFLERTTTGTAKTTDSAITSAEFPVGCEQNPAKNLKDLPNGTGVVMNLYGNKMWYLNGQRHREDGPAIEYANGDKYWYLNGKLHHEDGPAVEWANGYKEWYLNGEELSEAEFLEWSKGTANSTDSTITADEFPVGSEHNPASSYRQLPDGTGLVVITNGTKEWYKNWRLHCENGPAVEWAGGTKFWYLNGKLHREDGPAAEWADGYKEYFLNGFSVPAELFPHIKFVTE